MHVLAEPRSPLDRRRQPPPLLEEGDRLDSAEFMRRYERMPGTTAELIDRTVHIMASPVRTTVHAQPLAVLTAWLGLYVAKHPDLPWGTDGTVVLDDDHTVQPDLFLMLPPERGGRARLVDGYVHGAPELVIEVAASTASLDANAKAAAYAAAGVAEYLLFRTDDDPAPRVDWYALSATDRRYHPIDADPQGHLAGRTFPGLSLHRPSLLAGDLPSLLAAGEGPA